LRVAVIGAGAIGAVIAAAARDSGHEVWVCARTAIPSLVVQRGDEELTVGVDIATSTDQLPGWPAEILWVTTKATDTAGAAEWVKALCGPATLVAAAQNGLDHQARLAQWVPPGQVAPVLAYLAAERLAPGRVRHISGERMVVPASAADLLSSCVGEGGLVVRGTSDMLTAAWKKLLGNLVANPITALTRRRIGVMREQGVADLARGLLREAVQVGMAEGALVSDEDIDRVVSATTNYGEMTGSSMLYDVLAGRPLEHQYLTGEIVRRGLVHGIDVPLNSAVLSLLDALDRGIAAGRGG
jgi:2-dehydropantoate 2-reductase